MCLVEASDDVLVVVVTGGPHFATLRHLLVSYKLRCEVAMK